MSVKNRNAEKIVGAVFPISYLHFLRFLKDKKTIFVKFTRFKHLKEDQIRQIQMDVDEEWEKLKRRADHSTSILPAAKKQKSRKDS